MHKQLQTMLQSGVISESTSPWNSPLIVAKKKDGSLRLCVDFRCLNAQAKKDAKPLPRIDDTLSLLNGNSFFSSLDLISGIIGYYRKFIPKFSLKAAPLTELLKGKLGKRGNHKTFVPVQFYWTETQQQSFEELRCVLLEEVCLTHPDFNLPFTLEIDVSRGALGAVLSQEKDGKLRPIAFASRKTNTAESNYAAHRLEFLALKWAVTNKFKDYLQ